jgi:hypothetical protein
LGGIFFYFTNIMKLLLLVGILAQIFISCASDEIEFYTEAEKWQMLGLSSSQIAGVASSSSGGVGQSSSSGVSSSSSSLAGQSSSSGCTAKDNNDTH